MNLVFALLIAVGGDVAKPAADIAINPLQCRASGAAKTVRRCSVAIPAARSVRVCTANDASAGHCIKRGKKHKSSHVAWIVASRGAKCKIDKKRSDWSKSVTVRLSKKSSATATCDLFLELT